MAIERFAQWPCADVGIIEPGFHQRPTSREAQAVKKDYKCSRAAASHLGRMVRIDAEGSLTYPYPELSEVKEVRLWKNYKVVLT